MVKRKRKSDNDKNFPPRRSKRLNKLQKNGDKVRRSKRLKDSNNCNVEPLSKRATYITQSDKKEKKTSRRKMKTLTL